MRLSTRTDAQQVRSVVISTGVLRLAIGGVLLLRPRLLARLLGTDSITARNTEWIARMVASREIGLGLVALEAARSGSGVPTAMAAQAVADGGDALALLLALQAGRVSRVMGTGIVVAAAAGTAAEVYTAQRALADG